MIACCGIDCLHCDIRLIPTDDQAAARMIAWFQKMGWLEEGEGLAEIMARSMICNGCREDRSLHWSPDCWILRCCVDERGLQHCSQCEDFPCERLVERSREESGYGEALERLKAMAAGGGS
ncbi:MAG: DUF3795 domain-containing protein [Anaerolineales bacterium]|jgi:hypothetical protein